MTTIMRERNATGLREEQWRSKNACDSQYQQQRNVTKKMKR
jgi:sarcosine oxidase delta subunit